MGLLALAGCAGSPSRTLGKAPADGSVTQVAEVKPAGPVLLRGTMYEKCPVAGCWFRLRDKSGEIKVDTKGAGFVVSEVPTNTEVTVAGTLSASGERRIVASGIRY